MISTRTPEGFSNHCPVCGHDIRIEPSTVPVRDAPCPQCGCLLTFDVPAIPMVRCSEAELMNIFSQLANRVDAAESRSLRIDLGDVMFLSSATLGKLLMLVRRATAAGCRITLCNLNPVIAEVFQVTKLDQILNVEH